MNYLQEEDLDLYELTIEEETDGVFANSFVESGAIERDFVFFNKEKEVKFQSINDEKRLVAGPILIPNKKIIRMDDELGMYNVFLKPETVETLARKFMKNKYNNEVTLEHDRKVDGVYLTESWIIEESSKDKSNLYGFTLPRKTWFGIYAVDNDKVWEEVKAGKYKGFSVEMIVNHKKSNVKPSQLFSKNIDELNENEAYVLLSYIKDIVKKKVQLETYNDYPESARNNACKVLRWIDEHGRDEVQGMTQVGLARANQLCKGENISEETIARMASFSRHEQNSEVSEEFKSTPWKDKGYVAWLGWGGTSGIQWAKRKLESIRNE